ncbi:sulfotransferase [Candidatus Neomarinimicrobiota bacterium]
MSQGPISGNFINLPPVFIIGNPRSGTTLLRLMLTCHLEVVIPPEGAFMLQLYRRYGWRPLLRGQLRAFVGRVLAAEKMKFWNLDAADLTCFLLHTGARSYHDLVAGVYRFYAQRQKPACRLWGDKNNFHLNHIPKIHRLFPAARFLHIVRDGRDVACSYISLQDVRGHYAPNLPQIVAGAAQQWHTNLAKIETDLQRISSDQHFTFRYEDLVIYPEKTLGDICSFLGLEFDAAMLNFAEENRKLNLEPQEFSRWKQLNRENLTQSQIGRWKSELTPWQVESFNQIAGETLERYQYIEG